MTVEPQKSWGIPLCCCLIAAAHLLGVWYCARTYSPTWDELPHMVSGRLHWDYGWFRPYHVNPPLARLLATTPGICSAVSIENPYTVSPQARPEFSLANAYLTKHSPPAFQWLVEARWATAAFSALGIFFSYRWAKTLYGGGAAVIAVLLWSVCPNLIGHAALCTPDVAAAALGVGTGYAFHLWLKESSWRNTAFLTLLLSLAQLTKFTWLFLYLLFPVIWILVRYGNKENRWRAITQFAACCVVSVFLINLCYGFEGSFTKLGEFEFISESLGGIHPKDTAANRFQDSWLGSLPVPLPYNYVCGIDSQRYDFEKGLWSYFRGEWRQGGWWQYYLYALAIKVPLGTWLLLAVTVYCSIRGNGYSAGWRNELALLSPGAALLVLVSSQTGFNHHLRYVLPALPFFFIWISQLGQAFERRHKIRWLVIASLAWTAISSLSVFPHSLCYFNETIGGPRNGHYHLGNSNTDWGQDLFNIKRYYDEHPEVRPFHLGYDQWMIDPRIAGIVYEDLPKTPQPGWFVVSVNRIHDRSGNYEYFLRYEPVDYIGYTTHVYHLTQEQIDAREARP